MPPCSSTCSSAWSASRPSCCPAEPGSALAGSFTDPATGDEVAYGVDHLPGGLALSFVAGNVSGLLGVGGGAIKVPVMNLLMGVPLRAAIATSNLMIGVTAATGALIFFGRGLVEPRYAVPTAIGILIGAQLGPRVSGRVSVGAAAPRVRGAARRAGRADGPQSARGLT